MGVSADKLYDIYSELAEMRFCLETLTPDPTWPDAKCEDCGYYVGKGNYDTSLGCRKHHGHSRKNDPACPTFVRRPTKAEGVE